MYKMRFSLPIACLLLAILPSLKQETVFAYDTEAVVSPLVLYGDVYGFGGMPSTPWRTLGTATTSLTVTVVPEDSQTFPDTEEEVSVTLTTSDPVSGSFEVLPRLITVDVKGQGETVLTISGLLPDTTYHQYLDSYENHTEVRTDAEGMYSFTLDLTNPHVVFIQPHKSTYFLKNDATGGDCEVRGIGAWDPTTNTCTLTHDITETVQIGGTMNGVSDGITLDGGGYTLRGSTQGLYIYGANNIVVKNLSVENCSKGIVVDGVNSGSGISLFDITTNENITGLDVQRVENFTVRASTFQDEQTGSSFSEVHGLTIEDVDVTLLEPYLLGSSGDSGISISITDTAYIRNVHLDGGYQGLFLYHSTGVDVGDISITHATYPIQVWLEDNPTYMNNEIRAQVDGAPYVYTSNRSNVTIDASIEPAVALTCAFCTNTTITGYTFNHPKLGVVLFNADGVTIENSIVKSGGGHGVQTIHSSGVVIRNNDIYPVNYAPLYFSSTPAGAVPFEVYHNNMYAGVGTEQYVLVTNDQQVF